jgi:hypothetical protein
VESGDFPPQAYRRTDGKYWNAKVEVKIAIAEDAGNISQTGHLFGVCIIHDI